MPSPNLPQGIVDPLNAGFQAATCLALDAYNTVGNVTSIALPDAQSAVEPTAEWRNTINAAIRSFADYVQGLTPITALQITTYFRVPRYANAALTNPLAVSQGTGSIAYNTTSTRPVYSNGTTWVELATSSDVAGAAGIEVVAEGGAIDDVFTHIEFDEDHFAVTDEGGGSLSFALATDLPLSTLASGSAQSVVGRSANSTGEHADIAGTGTAAAPTFLTSADTVAFRSVATLGDALGVLLEQDLTALSTNAFTDGSEVVGALTVTVANTTNAGATWGVLNGTGLQMSVASATRSWDTSEANDAPGFYFAVTQLTGFRGGRPLYIDVVIAATSHPSGNDRSQVGLYSPANSPVTGAADRYRYGWRGNSGGTDTIGVGADATRTAYGTTTAPTAMSTRIDPNGPVMVGFGTYSGGWPQFNYVVANNTFAGTGANQFSDLAMRVFFAQCTGAGTSGSITYSRWRFRQ